MMVGERTNDAPGQLFARVVGLADQIAAVRREIAMRQSVYPRRVADKKMSQAKADHEIAAMQAVLATLEKV